MDTPTPDLRLDPGSRPRRPSSLVGRTCWLVAFGVLAGVVYAIYTISNRFLDTHHHVFYNGSLTLRDDDLEGYLKPLIDSNQTFDIGVTVWLRATQAQEVLYKEI